MRRSHTWMLGLAAAGLLSAGAYAVMPMNSFAQQLAQNQPVAKDSPLKKGDKAPRAEADEFDDLDLKSFMRRKLDACNLVLEGLVLENSELIKQGATTLHKMSSAEKWRVSKDVLYRQFSEDFQRITKDLIKSAEKNKIDEAALKYMDVTLSCLECHRFVRGIKMAQSP